MCTCPGPGAVATLSCLDGRLIQVAALQAADQHDIEVNGCEGALIRLGASSNSGHCARVTCPAFNGSCHGLTAIYTACDGKEGRRWQQMCSPALPCCLSAARRALGYLAANRCCCSTPQLPTASPRLKSLEHSKTKLAGSGRAASILACWP